MTARSAIIEYRSDRIVVRAAGRIRPAVTCLFTLAAIFFLTTLCQVDAAEDQFRQGAGNRVSDTIRFDLPAQPLDNALIVYAEITGVEVFVDHALSVGQYSGALSGEYSPEVALRTLLAGTGLQIRRAAERAYTVVAPAMQELEPGRELSWVGDHERMTFFATLQAAIMNALCTRSNFVLGQHRVALSIWIDPTGKVTDARMLTSPISDDASIGIAEGVRKVTIGQPPPIGLKQPVTFVILAKSPDRRGDCAALRSKRG
jgi:hypothetical protein